MENENLLTELEEAFYRFAWGLNAIELMVLGLGQAKDPYAGGFQAVWLYLKEAEKEAGNLFEAVSALGTTA